MTLEIDITERRAEILAHLHALPAGGDRQRAPLEQITRLFLDSPHFADAVRAGSDDAELFGVAPEAPAVRLAEQGLVSGLALSVLNSPKLEAIERKQARIRCASGAVLVVRRHGPGNPGRPWWEHRGTVASMSPGGLEHAA